MIKSMLAAAIGLSLTACATSTTNTSDTVPASLPSVGLADAAAVAPVVEIAALPNEAAQDVVCVQETKPGSRIVIGERCYAREQSGMNAETREYIQREISGRGLSPGWKTEQQIQLERGISLGRPMPPQ